MIKKMMTAPCSLNTEPYLTEWHADLESGMEIWIQTSEDESNPKWVRLGSLFERCWKIGSQWPIDINGEFTVKWLIERLEDN